MKLHADTRRLPLLVTSYDDGHVAVDGLRHTRSLLLVPGRIDAHWGPAHFDELTAQQLVALLETDCDVLLLGTGRRQRLLSPALSRPFLEAGRPLEVMGTAAACRTWNILYAEGRVVAAALIVEAAASSPKPC